MTAEPLFEIDYSKGRHAHELAAEARAELAASLRAAGRQLARRTRREQELPEQTEIPLP